MDVEIPNFPPLVFEFDEKLNVVSEYTWKIIIKDKKAGFIPPFER